MDNQIRVVRAAGILEGEGSFLIKTGATTIIVTCQMTDKDVIGELYNLFGGNVCEPAKQKDHHKRTWRWTVSGTKAEEVMVAVRPYMFTRRTEAVDKALSLWYGRRKEIELKKEKVQLAFEAYKRGEGSLRELGIRFSTSRTAICRLDQKEKAMAL